MLKKLLKYDFKALFKYWWIAAIVSVGLGIIAGNCIPIVRSTKELPQILIVCSWLLIILAVIGVGIFAAFATVMLFIRFYKNLFTDEGYLTFTLPVKRGTILNSKIISGVVFTFITILVNLLDVGFIFGIGYRDEIFTKEFFEYFKDFVTEVFKEFGAYTYVYMLEVLLIFIACLILAALFLYICITLASIITKKARVITSIGIYYGATCLFVFVSQLLLIFGANALGELIRGIPESTAKLLMALIALCFLLFILVLCGVMYVLEHYMIDRKLNLA